VQFRVKDGDGKLINGMYYTVKCKNSGEVHTDTTQGSTAVNTERSIETLGLTLRVYTTDADEEVYLYIGHRTAADGYPEDRTAAEDAVDEAPLAHSTVAPDSEKKIADAPTNRKWKPWKASATYKSLIEGAEGRFATRYASPEGGNDTIGIGHKITDPELASRRFDQGYWAEPLSDAKMNELLDQDIAKNGGNDIDNNVFVPLHNYEVDAILDLGFNGGPGALNANASSLFAHNGSANPAGTNRQKLSSLLNRGRYSLVPEYFQTHYNTANRQWMPGVQNRRDMDARMFSGDTANGYTLLQNHTSRHPLHRNP
jgi:GH24 family phage-related lysozyme (muramidase)